MRHCRKPRRSRMILNVSIQTVNAASILIWHAQHATKTFAGVRYNSQAQFREFGTQLAMKEAKIEAMVEGIKPVLDFIDPELPILVGAAPSIVERCNVALSRFKEYARGAASSAAVHALAI